MQKLASDINNLTNLVLFHLKTHNIETLNTEWKIDYSPLGGRGLFAGNNIKAGEVIFVDYPLLKGPRVSATKMENCISCYKTINLRLCSRKCGLLVCSDACENERKHINDCKNLKKWSTQGDPKNYEKLMKCMAPIHAFSLKKLESDLLHHLIAHPQHENGREIDILTQDLLLNINHIEEMYLRKVCAILDSNAFETVIDNDENTTISVRSIYPLAALVNHSCVPNIAFVFDCKQYMIARALVDIKRGEEVLHSYNKIFWGTLIRRHHLLKTKHFSCNCARCSDPTEFGTYMSAVLCRNCTRQDNETPAYVVPTQPLRSNNNWRCNHCGDIWDAQKIASMTSILASRLETLYEVDDILSFLRTKLNDLVPINCNQIAIALKYQLLSILGNRKGYSMSELPEELLNFKETICLDLLKLLQQLCAGECKLKGYILYALYTCRLEKRKRFISETTDCNDKEAEEDIKNILDVSSKILLYDVSAPSEIKKQWKHHSILETIL